MYAIRSIVLIGVGAGLGLLSFWTTVAFLGGGSGADGLPTRSVFTEVPRERGEEIRQARLSAGGRSELRRVPRERGEDRADGVGIRGRVAFRKWDRSGRLTREGAVHNTVHDLAKNVVFERIVSVGAQAPYDAIAAVESDQDSAENGILESNVIVHLDGDPDAGGNQNPADGAIGTDFESEPGNGTVRVTFTAKADEVTVKQIVLTKGPEDDTLDGALAIEPEDIFAFVDVPNISLAAGDAVEYTWSIDVD